MWWGRERRQPRHVLREWGVRTDIAVNEIEPLDERIDMCLGKAVDKINNAAVGRALDELQRQAPNQKAFDKDLDKLRKEATDNEAFEKARRDWLETQQRMKRYRLY